MTASETAYPEPPRRTVLAVACPRCGAGQQEKCISRTGRQTYDAHSARFAMAKRAGVFDDPEAERADCEKKTLERTVNDARRALEG